MGGRASYPAAMSETMDFTTDDGRLTARYCSGRLVREETLEDGMLRGRYWSATGHAPRSIPTPEWPPTPPTVFELEIDGQDLGTHWDLMDAGTREGGKPGTVEGVVRLRHRVRPVELKVVTRLDGTSIAVRYLEVRNASDRPQALSRVSPWCGLLWNTAVKQGPVRGAMCVSGGDGGRFSACILEADMHGMEGDLLWRRIEAGTLRLERVRAHVYSSPYWILRNGITGELCFLALAWSGPHYAEFIRHEDVNPFPEDLAAHSAPCLSFRTGPAGPAPLRILGPGETVTTPEVHLGMLHGSMDEAVAEWHAHVRGSVIPRRPKGKEMFLAAGRVVEKPGDWILGEIDLAADMGMEAFMIDAGWYGDRFANYNELRGDWHDGGWLPGGIAGIREHAHGKGLLFGLWHESETIAPASNLAKAHPDWRSRRADGKETDSLNLSLPEAARHFEDTILEVIRGFGLDYYKIDYGPDLGTHGADGYLEDAAWRHYEALYRAYDRVLRECPSVALENCAGGGGRNDLGMMSRFHYACESDWSYFPHGIRAVNAMTMFLPPESLCHYHNITPYAHQTADLDTGLRLILFCPPVFVGFGGQAADPDGAYGAAVKRHVRLFREFCGPILASGPAVFHHTPAIGLFLPADWCVLEYAARDRTRGYAGIFKIGPGGQDGAGCEYLLRPRGLDLGRDYEVRFDNRRETLRIPGRDLALGGIPVRLDSAMTSELLLFRGL
jgi:alpha-galactosidase